MIDGSSDNSILNLIVGYNGLGRLTGSGGGPGGGGAGGNFSGQTGLLRLFNDLMGGQASWLLPAALLVLVAGLAWRLRAPRTDRTRAALLLWGSWLVLSGLVFSLSAGVIHTYYTVALAPAIAALVAIGAAVAWRRREVFAARALLAFGVIVTAVWSIALLNRTPSWQPWLVSLIAIAGGVAAVGLLMPARILRRLSAATAVIALIACLAGPVAYSAQAIGSAHTGSVPSAGPSVAAGGGPPGVGRFPSASRGFSPPSGTLPGRSEGALTARGGTFLGAGNGLSRSGSSPGAAGTSGGPGTDAVSSSLVAALKSGASGYRWAAATSGSQSAASLELASGGVPIMAIGGFSGQGGNLSLAKFEAYVGAGKIHYYIASGGGAGGPGGGSSTSAITSWVKAHYHAETIGGVTVYDLTQSLES
jgi:hypothetical protein